MAARRALVTGAAGQDGRYLVALLGGLGYAVHAQSRDGRPADESSVVAGWHNGELTDGAFLDGLLNEILPDEIYNLAAVSSPRLSWQLARETTELNALVPLRLCQWAVESRPQCRIFQASSSDMFGSGEAAAQSEATPFNPQSPYAAAKLYAHNIVGVFRNRYGLHACSGIMFNHESPRRPLSFVSQKIAYAAAAISLGISQSPALGEDGRPIVDGNQVHLGNLDVRRDFGYAGDFVEAMHLILQHPQADDYVIGTGQSRSIREFCDAAFRHVGLDWQDHVVVDPNFIRAVDSVYTRADTRKIRERIGWRPKTDFDQLVAMMVDANVATLRAMPEPDAVPAPFSRVAGSAG